MGGLVTFAAVPRGGVWGLQLPRRNRNRRKKERKKERKEEFEKKEKEEKLIQKAKEIRNATIEARRVAAQLQLMAGQLGCLANHILAETKK